MPEDITSDSLTPDPCELYFGEIYRNCGDILRQSFANDTEHKLAKAHAFTTDLKSWSDQLSHTLESPILSAVLREYQFSLAALTLGLYRQAFGALRLTLEMAVAGTYFSSNELLLRLWLRGERYVAWEECVNVEDGVFSKVFIRVYNNALMPELKSYSEMASRIYRECSELGHGFVGSGITIPDSLQYDETSVSTWLEKADSVKLVISFLLFSRYAIALGAAQKATLEHVILGNLGHLPQTREYYGDTSG